MTIQLIDVGTVANDRTGDDLRDAFIKINDNTAELYGNPLTNVVNVNSMADFPTPVGGVIELVPLSGDPVTYIIGAQTIDASPNVFSITNGNVAMIGANRFASALTTTASGTMFTCTNSAFFSEVLVFECPSAKWIDFTNTTPDILSMTCDRIIWNACDSLGTISGAFTTSLRVCALVDTTTNGFTWVGTTNDGINIVDFLALSWTGTLFDLGTATVSSFHLGGNSRLKSVAGNTTLSGLAASGNLTASGSAQVSECSFSGVGTALSGIDVEDLQWDFTANIFDDVLLHNTRSLVDGYMSILQIVGIATIGTYVAVNGGNWLSDVSDRFTIDAAGLITYIGLENIEVKISAASTVAKVGGGADKICTKIAIDGVVREKTVGCTENASPTGVVSQGLFLMITGRTVQLFVGNEGSTANIEVSLANIIVSTT